MPVYRVQAGGSFTRLAMMSVPAEGPNPNLIPSAGRIHEVKSYGFILAPKARLYSMNVLGLRETLEAPAIPTARVYEMDVLGRMSPKKARVHDSSVMAVLS